jgi:hypothetical protein
MTVELKVVVEPGISTASRTDSPHRVHVLDELRFNSPIRAS